MMNFRFRRRSEFDDLLKPRKRLFRWAALIISFAAALAFLSYLLSDRVGEQPPIKRPLQPSTPPSAATAIAPLQSSPAEPVKITGDAEPRAGSEPKKEPEADRENETKKTAITRQPPEQETEKRGGSDNPAPVAPSSGPIDN